MLIKFSHDPSKGVKVPKIFSEKTCVFEIDLPARYEAYYEASFKDIAFGANEIAAPCIYEEPHLGGLTKIGDDGVLNLFVYGQKYEPPNSDGDEVATS